MTGMGEVIQTRLSGLKPGVVFVNLVTTPGRWAGYLGGGCFVVEVSPQDRDIDLRPLVGCWVAASDKTGDSKAFNRLVKAIAKANPATLHMVNTNEQNVIVHQLKAGETSTSILTGQDAEALRAIHA